ncbi:MAG TPA: hypothetical protein VME66_11190 [Candidatus Acidoferrales bacterium]|nr:hypothetical protein [Candidatus Acidoferrales bacterium]
MQDPYEPPTTPQDEGTPSPGSTAAWRASQLEEEYVVDLIESVRRDRVVLNRAKRLGFRRAGG